MQGWKAEWDSAEKMQKQRKKGLVKPSSTCLTALVVFFFFVFFLGGERANTLPSPPPSGLSSHNSVTQTLRMQAKRYPDHVLMKTNRSQHHSGRKVCSPVQRTASCSAKWNQVCTMICKHTACSMNIHTFTKLETKPAISYQVLTAACSMSFHFAILETKPAFSYQVLNKKTTINGKDPPRKNIKTKILR